MTAGHGPPVLETIARARSIWDEHGGAIMSQPGIPEHVDELRAAIRSNRALMKRLQVVRCCSRCASEKPGGGCCGATIENWYDHYILVMNLMLGAEIPDERINEESCIFLGPTGCSLMARFHFCINYLCQDIKNSLSQRQLEELCASNGHEIYRGWLLENMLREYLASRANH